MKKVILLFLSICLAFIAGAQQLPTPEHWDAETFPFPIEFAPAIPYEGAEIIRFTPGWGDVKSEQLWSYCFVWWIKEDSKLDAASLTRDLQLYYQGLVGRNIISRKIDSTKVVPVVAAFHHAGPKQSADFVGTVSMLDYLSQRPITLNVTVQTRTCADQKKKAVFFSISPQPFNHQLWKDFEGIWKGFQCTAK
jgi:hypothetical protein